MKNKWKSSDVQLLEEIGVILLSLCEDRKRSNILHFIVSYGLIPVLNKSIFLIIKTFNLQQWYVSLDIEIEDGKFIYTGWTNNHAVLIIKSFLLPILKFDTWVN